MWCGWKVLGGGDRGDMARDMAKENRDVVEERLQRKCVRALALCEKGPQHLTSRLKPPEIRGIPEGLTQTEADLGVPREDPKGLQRG